MTRILLERALLFAVPFASYGLYVLLILRQRPTTPPTPWAMLFIAGLSLVVISFLYLGFTEGETTKGVYVPPRVVNGRIVAGHVETKP